MDIEGDSVSVTKRCVALEDCLSTGCTGTDHEGNKVRESEGEMERHICCRISHLGRQINSE